MIVPFDTVPFIDPEEIDGFFRVYFITELEVPDKKLIGASVVYMGKGTGHTKHVHEDTTEVAYVLEGDACQSYWDGSDREHKFTMHAGELAVTSPQVVHQTMSLSTGEHPLAMYIFTARCIPQCYRVHLPAGESVEVCGQSESIFFILSGTGRVRLNDKEAVALPYTHIEFGCGDNLCLENTGNTPLVLLAFTTGNEKLPPQAEEIPYINGKQIVDTLYH